jgi:hypothetical protein
MSNMSGVHHGDGWEMTNQQYNKWYAEQYEPQEDDDEFEEG